MLIEVIEHLDPPRLAALERARVRLGRPGTVVVTTPNAEYNVRWEAWPPGTSGTATTGSSGPAPEFARLGRRGGRAHGYAVRFRARRPEDAEVGPPTQMAVFRQRTRSGRPMSERSRDAFRSCPWSCWSARPARASPRSPHALQADRGDLLGLLPRPGRRRRERPDRHRGRLRRAALHRRQAAGRRPADRRRRDQRPGRGAQAAGRAGPRARRAAGRDRARRARAVCARAQRRARRTGDFGAHVVRRQHAQLRRVAARPAARGLPQGPRAGDAEEIDGGDDRARAAVERPARPTGPVRHHRRRARLLRRAGRAARQARLPLRRRRGRRHRGAPRGPHGGLRRRPGRPRPGHAGRAAPGRWRWSRPGTRCACPATTRPSCCARCAAGTSQVTHGLAETLGPARPREAEPEFRAEVERVPRRAGQPLRAGRRPAGRRPRRAAGGVPRPGVRPGPRVRAVRRHDRGDRRVRPAGPLPVGRGLPGPGDGRLRPHAGARARVGQQHHLPRHRLRLRRPADRAALAGARAGLGAGRAASTTSRPGRWPRRGQPRRRGRGRAAPGRAGLLDIGDVLGQADRSQTG